MLESFIWTHFVDELKHPVSQWHRQLMANTVHQRCAVAAPRGFAKSFYISYWYPLFAALERPGTQIQLISSTGNLAEFWLKKIQSAIETRDTIRDFYGHQIGEKWTSEELHFANGSVIMAKGAGKQLRGFRPDIIIADDLETDEMVISKDRREKFDHWFWTDLSGMLLSHGQILVIGTILHPDSFLSEIIRHGRMGWTTKIYSALDTDGKALWPDQWPVEVLDARRKEMGEYAFAQEYMNDPIPDELRVFQERWFKYYEDVPQNCVYFTTVDPAIAIGDTADFTAIVTCAVDEDENVYVVDYTNKRMLPSETVDSIFMHYDRFKSAVIAIETEGFQKMIRYDLERERIKRKKYPVIVDLKSGGRRKGLRIEALQPFFEAGKVHIRKGQEDLRTQLLRYPSPRCKDDIIDALAYQLDIIRPSRAKAKVQNPNSFIAELERSRGQTNSQDYWGNQAIRSNSKGF